MSNKDLGVVVPCVWSDHAGTFRGSLKHRDWTNCRPQLPSQHNTLTQTESGPS